MRVLVTGSAGLIGSEAADHYCSLGHAVIGLDNNMRARFFGPDGDVSWRRDELVRLHSNYTHRDLDVRDRDRIPSLFREWRPDLVIHCAAQPSHDRAADIPFLDFEVNAGGTLNLLEALRHHAPEAVFVLMSTNKVYGDAPNRLPLVERETRWDFAGSDYEKGIPETFSIDRSTHSLFGASKLAADILVQEYGRYFGLATGVFRGGCLTGTSHSGAELHGFLAYLFKAVRTGRTYTVYGYKGKQVRDQIHSRDVIGAIDSFRRHPRPGEVYNLGGGKENSISVLEAICAAEDLSGKKLRYRYSDEHRSGDHIVYYTDLSKFRRDYPDWEIERGLDVILEELAGMPQLVG